jgi:acyl transferase domain-containing protein/3-hydroxymyristoyl/3-hydroxydecanoyl-(acyl carrier protein) dehydratase
MKDMFKKVPIAIVGMGGVFPGALNIDDFWQNIVNCVYLARHVPEGRWIAPPETMYHQTPMPDKAYSRKACFVDKFSLDPRGLDIDPELVSQLDPLYHFVLHAGRDAFTDSKTANLDKNRMGAILAAIALPTDSSSRFTRKILGRAFEFRLFGHASSVSISEKDCLAAKVTSYPASLLAKGLGLGGGSYTLDAACASSLYAVKLACDELQSFRADAMLAGGVSRPECLYTQVGFSQLRALSHSGRCAPFDKNADGLVVGEGAGILVLKRLKDAIACEDIIYAVIRGIGLSNDMSSNLLAPDSEGQVRAMKKAYQSAEWLSSDVDYIECHGAGTPVGDTTELTSLMTLWKNITKMTPGQCAIGSVKSNIGHLLTGAGAAGLIKTVLGLYHKTLPPSVNFNEASENSPLKKGPFRIQTKASAWGKRGPGIPRRAAVSAFGFGGINAHLLLEEYEITSSERHTKHEDEGAGEEFKNDNGKIEKGNKESDVDFGNENKDPNINFCIGEVPKVAVVGMSVYFGNCSCLRQFQEMIFKGETAITERPPNRWRGADTTAENLLDGCRLNGNYLKDIDIAVGDFRIPPNEIPDILPQQLLMLKVSAQALADAGFPLRKNRPEMGTIIGISFDYEATNFHLRWNLENQVDDFKTKAGISLDKKQTHEWLQSLKDVMAPPLTSTHTLGALGGIVASRIAKEFGLGGPGFVVSQEEASGIRALEIGVRSLQNFETDSVLVGAIDLAGDIRNVIANHRIRSWSKSGEVFPFDHRADGSLPGEGAAAVVLKRLDEALAHGDRIYAIVDGFGSSGKSISDTSAVSTYVRSLSASFQDAKIRPDSVSYFETLGTGNPSDDATEAEALNTFFDNRPCHEACAIGSVTPNIGNAGAALGLASVIKTCLCLYHEMIPPLRNFQQPGFSWLEKGSFHIPAFGHYWARNRKNGPRIASVGLMTCDETCMHVVLEGLETHGSDNKRQQVFKQMKTERKRPLGLKEAGLFCVTADNKETLLRHLHSLKQFISDNDAFDDTLFENFAIRWFQTHGVNPNHDHAVSIIARNPSQLLEGIKLAENAVQDQKKKEFNGRNLVSYTPEPLGPSAPIAFVFPGSGNHFLGMGREIGLQWPEIYRQLDSDTEELKTQMIPHVYVPWRVSWGPGWESEAMDGIESDTLHMIFGQVLYGGIMTNLIRTFGIKAESVIGYSLGESAGYFAMGVWSDRGQMLHRMKSTDLFSEHLAGACKSARKAWNISGNEPFQWRVAVVKRPAEMVKGVIRDISCARLLIVNTPYECVVGGKAKDVDETIKKLGCEAFFLEGVVTVHCDAALPVAEAYKALHVFPTRAPENVRFYSCANACAYEIDSVKVSESILKQALSGFDFPTTVNRAYEDGVRIFLEIGPHASCTRMIRTILKDRPHLSISASVRGEDEYLTVLKCLGTLVAERVYVNLEKLYGAGAYPYKINTAKAITHKNMIRVPVGGEIPCPLIPENLMKKNQQDSKNFAIDLSTKKDIQIHEPFSDLIHTLTKASEATAEAHQSFLNFSIESGQAYTEAFGLQARLLETLIHKGLPVSEPLGDQKPAFSYPTPAYSREMCMEFAIGSLAKVLGTEFAEVDAYPTRVRLPDEPLMLVDRILTVEGEKGSLTSGRVITEHDVLSGAWYLDGDRAPVCISVEAGQADLFLCSYLGIDLKVRGQRTYRLLDAVVEFSRGLPRPGDTIRYNIEIEKFVRQGDTYLFFFHFDGYIGNDHLITMTEGCAGFFTEEEIENSGGIILKKEETEFVPGKISLDYNPYTSFPQGTESYDEQQIDALRIGNLSGCFGPQFHSIPLSESLRLPGGKMKLIHRVLSLNPEGGRYKLGAIRAEADIFPDDWFLTCHFMDDMVMPGTLMYECCSHALRVLLQRMGWVTGKPGVCYEPVPGVKSRLKCRGPVTPKTHHVIYEVFLKEIGFSPEPYAIADALMYADGHPIVFFKDMSMKMTGATRDDIEWVWNQKNKESMTDSNITKKILYDRDRILAFAVGKPSEAFGKLYEVFDHDRKIARLPGPPYFFMDRVVNVEPEPWILKPDGWIEAEYDMPLDAWYYKANRTSSLPFCVLLEIALQPCGWLAAYAGSALKSSSDLKFRNLGGHATLLCDIFPKNGPLTMKSRLVKVSEAGDMIIEYFDFKVIQENRTIYEGDTYFGFFTSDALDQQVGIREADKTIYFPTDDELKQAIKENLPVEAPLFPDDPESDSAPSLSLPSRALLMIDNIDLFIPDGGPDGLGFIRGIKHVDPEEWFFKAHFYQDPVCPGSLGIESFLQLLKFAAIKRWERYRNSHYFELLAGKTHAWSYRGQIIPKNKTIHVEAIITQIEEDPYPLMTANGYLKVDGLVIYKMNDFGIRLRSLGVGA